MLSTRSCTAGKISTNSDAREWCQVICPKLAYDDNIVTAAHVALRLAGAKSRLEQAMTRDALTHRLEARPMPGDLVTAGVLGNPAAASRIQGVQRQLAHNMTINRIGRLLEQRSDLDTLQVS